MAVNAKIPEGYKDSSLGVIPCDWKIKELKDEIELLEAGVSVNSIEDDVYPSFPAILKTSAVLNGSFYPAECKKIKTEDIKRAKLNPKKDTIIISRMNTPVLVGECAYIDQDYSDLFLPDRLWQTKFFKHSTINVKWLNYLLNTDQYKLKIKSAATGTSNSMKNISKDSFLSIKIPYPTEYEQSLIAKALGSIDNNITVVQRLIAQKLCYKEWLVQELLIGRKRIKGFTEEWSLLRLGDLFKERVETGFNNLPLLSVGSNGIYPQTESSKIDTSNEDKSKYRRICKGDIGYNTMRMWQGRSALSQLEGIISPAYTVVSPNKNANALYFSYLFKTKALMHKFFRNSQGLVDDTLNCKFKDLASITVCVPPYDEQTAIVTVLQVADKEIELLKRKVNKLNSVKKGMMQLLLTGKKRLI